MKHQYWSNHIAIVLYVLMLLCCGLLAYLFKKQPISPTFIGLCSLPLIRNIYFLSRTHDKENILTSHMAAISSLLFVIIAIIAS